jgi:hypothetical protein
VLLWRDNTVESFIFVLHHRHTSSTVLLYNSKKQEVCVMNVRRDVNVEESVRTGGNNKKSKKKKKRTTFSTTVRRFSQRCMGNPSWWLAVVSVRSSAESAIVGRWSSETLRFFEGIWSFIEGQFGCLDFYVILRWSTLPLQWLHFYRNPSQGCGRFRSFV